MKPGDTVEITYRGVLMKTEGDTIVLDGKAGTANKVRRCINYDEVKVIAECEPPVGSMVICDTCKQRWVHVDGAEGLNWMRIGNPRWERWTEISGHLCGKAMMRVEWQPNG